MICSFHSHKQFAIGVTTCDQSGCASLIRGKEWSLGSFYFLFFIFLIIVLVLFLFKNLCTAVSSANYDFVKH